MDFVFSRRYCMAHRLIEGVGGKCAMPHGHNEVVKVRCRPNSEFVPGPNMSLDFASAKSVWHDWIDNAVDHSTQLSRDDPLVTYFVHNEFQRTPQLMITPGDPTTEMLALLMARKFQALCSPVLELITLDIEETPTNTVSLSVWARSHTQSFVDQWFLKPPDLSNWWDRPDLTINDFS